MKILQILFEYDPHYGGAARIAKGLSEELVRRGHEVYVIAASSGAVYEHRGLNGVDLHLIPFKRQIGICKTGRKVARFTRLGMEILAAANQLQNKEQFDIIHAHHYLAGYACQCRRESYDVPIIFTVHGLYMSQYGHLGFDKHSDVCSSVQNWRNGYQTAIADNIDQIEIRLCRIADAVICVSNSVLSDVRRYVHDGKLRVIHNFVDFSRIKTDHDLWRWRRRFASDEERIVLFVGRVEYSKGGDIVLEIAEEMQKRGEKIRFVLAGTVWMNVSHEKIQTLGHLGEGDLHACYEMCDLLIVPSRYDAFNLAACEAMAHRKPVLAHDAGGLREVVIDGVTGRLIDNLRPSAWADEICKLMGDADLLARLGDQGRENVKRHFDLKQQVDKYMDIYQTALEKKSFNKTYV